MHCLLFNFSANFEAERLLSPGMGCAYSVPDFMELSDKQPPRMSERSQATSSPASSKVRVFALRTNFSESNSFPSTALSGLSRPLQGSPPFALGSDDEQVELDIKFSFL